MKQSLIPLITFCLLFPFQSLKAQTKIIGECSLLFQITNAITGDTIGQKSVYIKGNQCKTVLETPQLKQGLFFDLQQTKATITKDIGASHFLQVVNYPPPSVSNLISMKESLPDSSIQILGYNCKSVDLIMSDGVIYQIWYTSEISATVNTFEIVFKEVPGLVLSYRIIPLNGKSFQYRAINIDLSPIPISQFNINTNLYQVIDE